MPLWEKKKWDSSAFLRLPRQKLAIWLQDITCDNSVAPFILQCEYSDEQMQTLHSTIRLCLSLGRIGTELRLFNKISFQNNLIQPLWSISQFWLVIILTTSLTQTQCNYYLHPPSPNIKNIDIHAPLILFIIPPPSPNINNHNILPH